MEVMVRSSGLKGYVSLLNSFAINPKTVLEKFHINVSTLNYSDTLIPLRCVVRLLEESAVLTKSKSFGLELSRYQNIEVLGPIALVIRHAKTVRNALALAIKYLEIHSPGIVLSVYEQSSLVSGAVELSIAVQSDENNIAIQSLELCIADLHNMLSLIVGEKYIPLQVAFPHAKQSNRYRSIFKSKTTFNHFRGGIHISPELLDISLQTTNQYYLKVAESFLQHNYNLKEEALKEKVQRLLSRFLGTKQDTKESICKMLAIHPRTLQRKLEKENTKFEQIKEEVKKEVLYTYLTKTQINLHHLTQLVGYSELSAMSRACKQWFGKSPTTIRKEIKIS